MTAVPKARLDLSDFALVFGAVSLTIGLGMVAVWLPFVVIGALLLALGSVPLVRR